MMIFIEYMTYCPKCKVLMRDIIKAHFLGGAFTNPVPLYLSPIDGYHRDALIEVGIPTVPLSTHDPRYVDFVPVVHGRRSAVAFPKMRRYPRDLYEIGSFNMRVLLKRLGEERMPPASSVLNERYGAEVVEHLRKQFSI